EIDEFLKDSGPDAHAKQVDRLLKSPRYGERQAQEWLDLARYADTSGYQIDQPRQVWKWREWVVNACIANMPFDRFTVEQLAGDPRPQPRPGAPARRPEGPHPCAEAPARARRPHRGRLAEGVGAAGADVDRQAGRVDDGPARCAAVAQRGDPEAARRRLDPLD